MKKHLLPSWIGKILSSLKSSVVALCYHRVRQTELDLNKLSVSEDNFHSHLAWLKENTDTLSVDELFDCIKNARFPKKGSIVTFDDGYADFYSHALPIISSNNFKTALYISPVDIASQTLFWWDELEQIVFQKQFLIQWNGAIDISDPVIQTSDNSQCQTLRQEFYYKMQRTLRLATFELRTLAMKKLRNAISSENKSNHLNRTINKFEFEEILNHPCVTIGSHGLHHLSMASQTKSQREKELKDSKTLLETLTKRKITTFAYPYGAQEDIDLVEEEPLKYGYEMCFSVEAGSIGKNSNKLRLPRMFVENWDKKEFALHFTRYLMS